MVFPPCSFFTLVVQMHSCKTWKACITAIILLCKPRKDFRCQMECERGVKHENTGSHGMNARAETWCRAEAFLDALDFL